MEHKNIVGNQDLSYLYKNWPKGQFLKIEKIAEILYKAYLNGSFGIKLYNPKQKYNLNDKIVVFKKVDRSKFKQEMEIYQIEPGDFNGEYCEWLMVRCIGSKKSEDFKRISNYNGKEKIKAVLTNDEYTIVKSKELIQEIKIRLKGDRRFDCFKDYWIPRDHIDENLKIEFKQHLFALLKRKCEINTIEFLNTFNTPFLQSEKINKLITANYLFRQIKYLSASKTNENYIYTWRCRKKLSIKIYPYHLDVRNKSIKIDSQFEEFLAYNGFTEITSFQFESGKSINVEVNLERPAIQNNELFKLFYNILSRNKVAKLSTQKRGSKITINPEKVDKQFRITVKENWLNQGIIEINKKISKYLDKSQNIEFYYNEDNEIIASWDSTKNVLCGFKGWYAEKGVDKNDIINLRLVSFYPSKFRIWTEYDNKLSFEPPPTDKNWERFTIIQCIYWVLHELKRKAHYREIFYNVNKHKKASIKSIISELSKNSDSLFSHSGDGFWNIGKGASQIKGGQSSDNSNDPYCEITPEIWQIVVEIEQNDLVYKILDSVGRPLAFNELCEMTWKQFHLNRKTLDELKETGFLNAKDERLRRFQFGEWGLEKWKWSDLIAKEYNLFEKFKSISIRLSMLLKEKI